MTEFVLRNNYFEFNGKVKQQISVTAIGTKRAPTYACIYMDEFENEFLSLRSDKPLVWLRYIDDVFFIWTHGEKELPKVMEDINSHQPSIKFTYTFSKNCVPFLDLDVQLSGAELTTNLHIMPTGRHQYLHFTSSHPNHTKRFIVYSPALRVSRICSRKCDFHKHISEMKTWFLRRGYPKNLLESEIKKSSSHMYLITNLKKEH